MSRNGEPKGTPEPQKRNSPQPLGDEKHPDDLFGDPEALETPPLPAGDAAPDPAAGSNSPVSESYKVGPRKPPLENRWVKGGASPNPRGRPPKKLVGPVKSILEREIEVSANGGSITRREALDRNLRQKAIEEGGGWKKLWEEQQAFDRKLSERVQRSLEREARSRDNGTAARVRRQIRESDLTFALFERAFPGMLGTIRILGPAWAALEKSTGRGSKTEKPNDQRGSISRSVARQSDVPVGSPRPRQPPPARTR